MLLKYLKVEGLIIPDTLTREYKTFGYTIMILPSSHSPCYRSLVTGEGIVPRNEGGPERSSGG